MVLLVEPFALVRRAVGVVTCSMTIQLVFRPHATIDGPICLDVRALTLSLSFLPVAEVVGQIRRLTETKAMLFSKGHLTNVS